MISIEYDPQRLLPDLRFTRLWANGFLEMYRNKFPDIHSLWLDIDTDELIDFERDYHDYTVFYVDSAGNVAYEKTLREPISRNLAPFVKPFPGTETGRWGESDVSPLADLEYYRRKMRDGEVAYTIKDHMFVEFVDLDNIDFSKIEERLLAKREIHNKQLMMYALGAASLGEMYEPKTVFKAATKPPPSYLDHDPTKKHRSVKRRRK